MLQINQLENTTGQLEGLQHQKYQETPQHPADDDILTATTGNCNKFHPSECFIDQISSPYICKLVYVLISKIILN